MNNNFFVNIKYIFSFFVELIKTINKKITTKNFKQCSKSDTLIIKNIILKINTKKLKIEYNKIIQKQRT